VEFCTSYVGTAELFQKQTCRKTDTSV